ncbi:hypothetical protein EJ03DRAFT_326804 [Teratosphaeria nubilosa]|uniref:Uncharacterized protein n=1 Tax=Teratosphaeria nubilosa TaxID=161662 RepID=A0A6G1LBD6_9PEZI|nr:hypothetical protein EJ03DRAFT_326804 [Teratosphaeria nubilosa]
MASVLTCRPARPSLLSLPPHLRVHAYQRAPRPFSASTAQQSALVDAVVAPCTALLDTLHATGLPWCAVIPLSALVARGLVVYRLSLLPARRAAQTHALLLPVSNTRVILASASQRVSKARAADEDALEKARDSPAARVVVAFRRHMRSWWIKRRTLHDLGTQFRVPYWHWRSGVGFGTLIAMTEAIRIKAGAREGLLPFLLSPFQYLGEGITELFTGRPALRAQNVAGNVDAAPPSTPLTSTTETTPNATISDSSPQTPTPSDPTLSSAAEAAQFTTTTTTTTTDQTSDQIQLLPSARDFDPTMQTEGLPWCLDLTHPDPTNTLPLVVSAYMMWNVLADARAAQRLKKNPTIPTPPPPQESTTATPQDAPLSHLTPAHRAKLSAPQQQRLINIRDYRERAGLTLMTPWQLGQLTFAYFFVFIAMKIPAGILVYMLASQAVGRLQGKWLERRMPLRRGVEPCRRPLRLRSRKQWED